MRVTGYSDSTKKVSSKQLNFISKYWQIFCLPSVNKLFWLFQVFWKRKWDGLWGNGLRPRRRSSLWPINLDWCDKKKKNHKKKDNKWDQWFRLRRSAPLLKMLMTRKKVNWKNSRLCLLNMRVLLHAEFLHLVSRIQNFQTSLNEKGWVWLR